MADLAPEPEPGERRAPDRLGYAPEPRFPAVLALVWMLFVLWAGFYAATRLVPAFQEWAAR